MLKIEDEIGVSVMEDSRQVKTALHENATRDVQVTVQDRFGDWDTTIDRVDRNGTHTFPTIDSKAVQAAAQQLKDVTFSKDRHPDTQLIRPIVNATRDYEAFFVQLLLLNLQKALFLSNLFSVSVRGFFFAR